MIDVVADFKIPFVGKFLILRHPPEEHIAHPRPGERSLSWGSYQILWE